MANFMSEQSDLQNIHIHSLFLHNYTSIQYIAESTTEYPTELHQAKTFLSKVTIHFLTTKSTSNALGSTLFLSAFLLNKKMELQINSGATNLGTIQSNKCCQKSIEKRAKEALLNSHGRLLFQGVFIDELHVRTARCRWVCCLRSCSGLHDQNQQQKNKNSQKKL